MAVETQSLFDVRQRFVPKTYMLTHPIVVESADGDYVVDEAGRRYLDFAGGISVANVGHRPDVVVSAIREQIEKLLHTGPVTANRPSIELARALSQRTSVGGDAQALFVNSGAEAIENAVKLARHATGRPGIIAFDRSFHGRTLLTATLTGKARPHKTQPGAMAPEIYHAPYPYPLHPPAGVAPDRLVDHTLSVMDTLLEIRLAPQHLAAVLVEPIQGEGGIVIPPSDFLPRVAEWTHKHDALLIVDEIQTGYGRTGRFYGVEHTDITPDIVTVGKSIANGLPLGGVIAGGQLWDAVVPGDIGGTYAGNPVACAAGLAVLSLFEDGTLLDHAAHVGDRLMAGLQDFRGAAGVGEVRGIGPMVAIEFVKDSALTPDPERVVQILAKARELGLLVISAGIWSSCVRLFPSLTASDQVIDDAVDMLRTAIAS